MKVKRIVRSDHKRLFVAGLFLVVLLSGCGSKTVTTTVTVAEQAPSEAEEQAERARDADPTPRPKADTEYKCDYLLDPDAFVASLTITNTGNIGIVVKSIAKWDQLGGGPVTMFKAVRVPRGIRKTVQFRQEATGQQIDAHQSADSGCRVTAKVSGTFGAVG